ncbi:MAG: phosphatase PAP2 family protein, partial [Bacteroidales bacterium]|nr:phosphatase PAP2 family protein [Bacteroidales bacterium]
KIITFAGDGAFPFIVGGILAFFSFRKAILVALGCSLAGLLAQFFKRAVFPDIKRPLGVFDQELLHLIPGVDLHTAYSFPSGHTTTVFSLAICLAIFSKNKIMKALWLLFALVTGFSRVYLSQHFLVDVYFGSILGVVTMLIIFRPFQRLKWEWLNKSVITLFKTPQNNK